MREDGTFDIDPFNEYFESNEYDSLWPLSKEMEQGEARRGSPEYVRWIQRSLNRILGLRLLVDGSMAPATRSAVRNFQQREGLIADGNVEAMTEAALIRAVATTPRRGTEVSADLQSISEPLNYEAAASPVFDQLKAIRLNRCMSEWLGWIDYRHEIYSVLGFARVCPTEAALSDAVRRWQQNHGLTADGIVGLNTLNNLLTALGRPTLPAEPTRPSWIRWDPSPNFSRRNGYLIDTIVLHATAGGSVKGAMQRFKNRRSEASAHFIILRNGVVLQLVELDQAAWHTSTKSTAIPGMNERSIGIEIVNPGGMKGATPVTVCEEDTGSGTKWNCAKSARITPVRPLPDYYRPRAIEKFVSYSEPQYRSVIRLVRYLIPCIPSIRLITGHEHLHKWHGTGKRFKNRVDPGGQFDWSRLEDALAGISPAVVVCHKFGRLSTGTNRLNPDWRDRCSGLP